MPLHGCGTSGGGGHQLRGLTAAAALGGPVFFSKENIERIAGRPDEAYRQRTLKM